MKFNLKNRPKVPDHKNLDLWMVHGEDVKWWFEGFEKELREKLKHPIHGYTRKDAVISINEILGE